MDLFLYNTATRTKEKFEPLDPGHVRFYVCGPTVYGPIHVGNARPIVVFDVLFRLLTQLYERVTYVRNITDVDDKIIDSATASSGRSMTEACQDLTRQMTALFHDNVKALGALAPTHEPRATAHIPQMISMIDSLLKAGHAYEERGHVLFSVPSFASYGDLSGRTVDELLAGARVEVEEYKHHPSDFVLWKPALSHEVGWESPWGYGRPGWHIECSAMSLTYLGKTFDIHGGGLDLVFPHHENERAQSMCGLDTPLMARVWMHNGYVVVGGEKMSKSLGNFLTVQNILRSYSGDEVRYVLLNAHYRQPLDIQEEGWMIAKKAMSKFQRAMEGGPREELSFSDIRDDFRCALLDDLNTPQAIAYLHDQSARTHKASTEEERVEAQRQLWSMLQILGFRLEQKRKDTITVEAIEKAIMARQEARSMRQFAEADRIRDDLLAQGVILEDGAEGTQWRWH